MKKHNTLQYSSQIVETDTASLEFSKKFLRFTPHTFVLIVMYPPPPQCWATRILKHWNQWNTQLNTGERETQTSVSRFLSTIVASKTSSFNGYIRLTSFNITKLTIDRVYRHNNEILRGSTPLHLPYRYWSQYLLIGFWEPDNTPHYEFPQIRPQIARLTTDRGRSLNKNSGGYLLTFAL